MANNRFPLELLSYTLLFEIIKYLSPFEKAMVAMTCKATLTQVKSLEQNGYYDKSHGIDFSGEQLHLFFNSRIHTLQKNLKQVGLYILKGKMDEALALIDTDHCLLLQVIPSITLKKHPSHVGEKFINRTLFQLALLTYDHDLYNAIGKRIDSKYGHEEKAKQFNEQFPSGVKSTKSYRATFDSLIKTMGADPTINFVDGQNIMNDKTRAELQALKDSLALMLTDKECTTGVHFDLQIMVDVIDAYEEGYNEFKNENKKWHQRALYWRCVFGLIENSMPYYVAMALNEQKDFFDVMEGIKKVTRSTVLEDGSEFFGPHLGDSHYIVRALMGRAAQGGVIHGVATLKTFVGLTQKNLDNLSNNCSNQQTRTYTK